MDAEDSSRPKIALLFYDDHDPGAFLLFQQLYLDNRYVRFLHEKGWIESFEYCRSTAATLRSNAKRTGDPESSDSDSDSGRDSADSDTDGEESDDSSFCDADDERLADLLHLPEIAWTARNRCLDREQSERTWCFTPSGVLPNESGGYTAAELAYLDYSSIRINLALYDFAKRARKSDGAGVEAVYSASLGVLVHPRYSGSVLLDGAVGDLPVVFGYTPSRKFELPCTFEECLLGQCPPNDRFRAAYPRFRCRKALVVTGDLDFGELDAAAAADDPEAADARIGEKRSTSALEGKAKKKPKAKKTKTSKPSAMHVNDGFYEFAIALPDVADALGPASLPNDFVCALRKSLRRTEGNRSCTIS